MRCILHDPIRRTLIRHVWTIFRAKIRRSDLPVKRKTNYNGKYFQRLFLSSTGISEKNKNHPLWDQRSSLCLGSEIVEARNQQIWLFLSPEISALPTSQNWDYLTFGYYLVPSFTCHHCLLCNTTAHRACCMRDRASSPHKRDSSTTMKTTTAAPQQHHSSTTAAPQQQRRW